MFILIFQVGESDKVLMLLSGGVDSTVCAALVTKALGQERVIAIHIDNGFMRKNESEQVFLRLFPPNVSILTIEVCTTGRWLQNKRGPVEIV